MKASLLSPVSQFLVLSLACNGALASGFAIIEQGASAQGNAYAGAAAVAEDASTVFFNPAGLIKLDHRQGSAGLHIIAPNAKFTNTGSAHVTTAPLSGGNDDGGKNALVPNVYYAMPLNPRMVFGLGIHAPFGLATEYADNWVGRYHAIESTLRTVNINPSLAYRLNAQWSVGAGISLEYADATLSNAIDFGTIDALSFGGAFGLTPQASDGMLVLEGDDWAGGFNLGVLFEPNDTTRIGAAFRSSTHHTLEGTADFTVPDPGIPAAAGGRFSDTGVKSSVNMPETVTLAFHHQFNPQWAMMADATWTRWSRLEELRFEFDNPAEPDGVVTLDWNNSWRVGVGASYRKNKVLTYRAGLAYDQTPIPSARLRTPRIPGEDRTWLTLGMGYRLSDSMTLDAAYTHIFVDEPKIDKSASGEDLLRGGLKGSYDASVDILSAQLTWHFQ